MAVTPTPAYAQGIITNSIQFVNATGTATQTLYTGDTNGTIISGIWATSTDTADRNSIIYLNTGAGDYQLFLIPVPLRSGDIQTVTTLDALNSFLLAGPPLSTNGIKKELWLKSGDLLRVSLPVAVTAAKVINFFVMGSKL